VREGNDGRTTIGRPTGSDIEDRAHALTYTHTHTHTISVSAPAGLLHKANVKGVRGLNGERVKFPFGDTPRLSATNPPPKFPSNTRLSALLLSFLTPSLHILDFTLKSPNNQSRFHSKSTRCLGQLMVTRRRRGPTKRIKRGIPISLTQPAFGDPH